MVRLNKILILAILAITFIALTGAADAKPAIHVKGEIDTVQSNGYYIGIPTAIGGDSYQFGYNYIFVPDGSFTISGTLSNDLKTPVYVWVQLGQYGPEINQLVTVPAAGKNPGVFSFSYTIPAGHVDDAKHIIGFYFNGDFDIPFDFTNAEYINEGDTTTHTIDQGPMSDATAIFSNGKMTYSGGPAYTISLGE